MASLEKRLPMLEDASPDDLDGRADRIFTDEFHAALDASQKGRPVLEG